MTWAEYLSTDPEPTCELQLAEESQREAIAVTETAYWTVSEGSEPLYFYARQDVREHSAMYPSLPCMYGQQLTK